MGLHKCKDPAYATQFTRRLPLTYRGVWGWVGGEGSAGLGRAVGWGWFAWAGGTSTPLQCPGHGCPARTTDHESSWPSEHMAGQTPLHAPWPAWGSCGPAPNIANPGRGGVTLQHLTAFISGRRCVQQRPTTRPTRRSSTRPA